jgi:hypothetical protein
MGTSPSPSPLAQPSVEWIRRKEFSRLESTPWANGLGTTTELLSFDESRAITPPARGQWRLSVARLDAPARFSRLLGLRRIFMPIGGSAVLSVDGREHRIDSGFTLHFSGDADTALVSLPTPCLALNFMTYDTKLSIGREVPVAGSAVALVPLEDGVFGDGTGESGTSRISRFDLLTPRRGDGVPADDAGIGAIPASLLSGAIAIVQWP